MGTPGGTRPGDCLIATRWIAACPFVGGGRGVLKNLPLWSLEREITCLTMTEWTCFGVIRFRNDPKDSKVLVLVGLV